MLSDKPDGNWMDIKPGEISTTFILMFEGYLQKDGSFRPPKYPDAEHSNEYFLIWEGREDHPVYGKRDPKPLYMTDEQYSAFFLDMLYDAQVDREETTRQFEEKLAEHPDYPWTCTRDTGIPPMEIV